MGMFTSFYFTEAIYMKPPFLCDMVMNNVEWDNA